MYCCDRYNKKSNGQSLGRGQTRLPQTEMTSGRRVVEKTQNESDTQNGKEVNAM